MNNLQQDAEIFPILPAAEFVEIFLVTEFYTKSEDYFPTRAEAEDWQDILEGGGSLTKIEKIKVQLSAPGVCRLLQKEYELQL